MSDVKILKCPSCAGDIKRNQSKCDWCQRDLDWDNGVIKTKYGSGSPVILDSNGNLTESRRREQSVMLEMRTSAVRRYCEAFDLNQDDVIKELNKRRFSTPQTLTPIRNRDKSMVDRIKEFFGGLI